MFPYGQSIFAGFDPSLPRLLAVKIAYVYRNIWEFAFDSIYFRHRIIYHEILWFPRRIPALDDIKGFRDAFIVLVLAEKFGYNLITHIGVDTHEKQRDRILSRFVGGIHKYKVTAIPEEKPPLPFFLVYEQKLCLVAILDLVPCPEVELG